MRRLLLSALLTALGPPGASAQQVAIDRGVRAGDLWCFPLAANEAAYVYLPTEVRLARGEDGRPRFSFLRYVLNQTSQGGENAITAAEGGGVLHFLVALETPEEAVAEAERELPRVTGRDGVVLRGPIVFSEGRFNLVSSILTESGETERRILATGRAPVLEGGRLAFSFPLSPEQASLLLESLKMPTPDVSLVFDMTFTGLTEAYEAELVIDWSEVRKSHAFGAGGTVYFVSADVEMVFEDLLRNHAIELRSSGSSESMEALLDTVYAKLLDLLFRPVEPERVPAEQKGDLLDALSALADPRSGPLSSRKTLGFGAYVGYQLKDLRSEGRSVLDFRHRAAVERHRFITFNIGDLYSRYGDDPRFFRAVNLSDPAFLQREIRVAVDGGLLSELERQINSVTVTLRKEHQNGEVTLRELVLDRNALASGADLRMVYGWSGDEDRLAWLEYEYRTRWSFNGGGSHETDWARADAPMVNLYSPYERKTVEIVGSSDSLKSRGVRAVVVTIDYPFFAERRREKLVLRPGREEDSERSIEITLPLGQPDYRYSITWMLEGARRRTVSGEDATGVVFVDELPPQEETNP